MLISICYFLLKVLNLNRATSWGPSIQTREPMGHLVGSSFSGYKSPACCTEIRTPVYPFLSCFTLGKAMSLPTPPKPFSRDPISLFHSSQPKMLCASCRSLIRSKSNHVPSLPKNHSCRLRQKQITRFYFKIIAHLPLEGSFRINRLKKKTPSFL